MKPEPLLGPEAFETEKITPDQAEALIGTWRLTEAAQAAKARFDIEYMTWGRSGWLQVERLCRAAKRKIEDLPAQCPPEDEEGDP